MLVSTVIPHPLRRSARVSSVPFLMIAICLVATVTAINTTNINPLIPLLAQQLGVDNGRIGLLSTGFFLGLTVTILPTGLLLDRYGARRVVIGAFWVLGLMGVLLPLLPASFAWILIWRTVIGLMVGVTFVAGTYAVAHLGAKYMLLGQGLFGGFVQVGFGLGVMTTPLLVVPLGWRNAFVVWGLLAFGTALYWFFAGDERQNPVRHQVQDVAINPKLRSASIWAAILLGLTNMGTFGVENTLAAWITVYLTTRYGLPLALAAGLGSTSLFAGMIIRPLTGILLARNAVSALALMRLGTTLACASVVVLASPFYSPAIAITGILLLAIGANLPFAGVFATAARVGAKSGIGVGTAQGISLMLAMPISIIGIPLIGFIFEHTGSFTPAFGAVAVLFCSGSVLASVLLGPVLKYIMEPQKALPQPMSMNRPPSPSDLRASGGSKPWKQDVVALIQALPVHASSPSSLPTRPLILLLNAPTGGDEGSRSFRDDSGILLHLLDNGFSPMSLPLLSTLYKHPQQVIKDDTAFYEIFDQMIWPVFSLMLFHRIRGFCVTGSEALYFALKDEAGEHENHLFLWREMIERYVDLLARLIGMPVLEIGPLIPSLQTECKEWSGEQMGAFRFSVPGGPDALHDGDGQAAILSAFSVACASYVPPDLDALQPLRGEVRAWLRQHDHILFLQLRATRVELSEEDNEQGARDRMPKRWTKDKLLDHKRKRMVTDGQPRPVHVRKPTRQLLSSSTTRDLRKYSGTANTDLSTQKSE